MIELEVIDGVARGCRLTTNVSRITIGRSPAATLVIPDPRVSWHHGEIVFAENHYIYRALRTARGTTVRRAGTDLNRSSTRLCDGDLLLLAGEENVLRVNAIQVLEAPADDLALTFELERTDDLRDSEAAFVDDASALRIIVDLDRVLVGLENPSASEVLSALVEQIARLYPELEYVAVLRGEEAQVNVAQSLPLRESAFPRPSSKLHRKLKAKNEGFVFTTNQGRLLTLSGSDPQSLSTESQLVSLDTAGICVPIRELNDGLEWIQLERVITQGAFGQRDLELVSAMARRAGEHLKRLALRAHYDAASQDAALGVFAEIIGHDLKNVLIFTPFVREWLENPAQHATVALRVEHAYRLALSLYGLVQSDEKELSQFSLNEIALSIQSSFEPLFAGRCKLESHCLSGNAMMIISHDELLYRLLSNLVLNAFAAHEQRRFAGQPYIRIRIEPKDPRSFRITVEDNAGGMHPMVFEFAQELFEMVRERYAGAEERDLMGIVEHMRPDEDGVPRGGRLNCAGLFFCAVAVNDMHGTISVQSTEGRGTRFVIELSKSIDMLKGLLRF